MHAHTNTKTSSDSALLSAVAPCRAHYRKRSAPGRPKDRTTADTHAATVIDAYAKPIAATDDMVIDDDGSTEAP